ncbi:hypothetical protein EYW49_06700 [Siculibacillus lacustris]|uniref:Uncharacterized protein n=1 Tax=Siculibacillus lacustris TaxID=1549641 RepID=A0A4Q9VU69_9HYPH|nr:hypothetical protein [Siculibacillus lacustris]TBW39552.1 hypothetical protein EYW49_06700 [Siculibacillus lacustris]
MRIGTVVGALAFGGLVVVGAVTSADAAIKRVAKSGVVTEVGKSSYYAPRTCMGAAPPSIRVVTPPQHGVVSVTTGQDVLHVEGNCAGKPVTASFIFYRSDKGYHGPDGFAVEIDSEAYATRRIGTHTVGRVYEIDVK